MEPTIRKEKPEDYRKVEEITRKAFWNLHFPGCDEHYLVHIMRNHPDFLPELDFVLEKDGEVIGNIMYTKSSLTGEDGSRHGILTFGPVCIVPEHQRRGYGRQLILHSVEVARSMGHAAIVIYGNPNNYVNLGFKSCKRYNICNAAGAFPSALMAIELQEGILRSYGPGKLKYAESPVYALDPKDAEAYDAGLEPMEKTELPGQEVFFIMVQSTM
ncbi:MAG: N-acetyltransferase, partial [Opitutales bacterium]|nr:N-acetyltransferase [Opitutales bacterium]